MAGQQTEGEQLWQKVGQLEGEVHIHRAQIAELFSIDRQQAETNAETAKANAVTAEIVKSLAETVKAQHTPETCPQRPKIDRMWTLFIVLTALVGVLGALGLLGRIGSALWNAVFH